VEDQAVNRTFFARADDAQVGEFHYHLGLVEFTLSEPAKAIVMQISEGRQQVSVEQRDESTLVQLAYEVTSFFHEMRHFVDTFGTMAGISLFSARLVVLKEFVALSEALNEARMRWDLPLSKWAMQDDCPQAVRDVVRRARTFDIASDIYIAPFTPVEIDGHREDLKIELDYERGGKADAFPLRIGRIDDSGIERLRTVLFPLGLEALMEGNAHALSRTLVEHYFPEPIAQRLQHRSNIIQSRDERGLDDQRAAQTTMPYMVTDLLITRFLKCHGISKFPRDLIFGLTDRALTTSSIQRRQEIPGTTEMHTDRAGGVLVDLLEAEDPQALGAGSVSDAPEMTKAYEALLAGLERGGDWQTVKDDTMPLSSIAIWESYIAQSFIVPLLRERLATGHRAFTSHEGFITLLPKIGLPPARVANGRLMLAIMPPRVQQAWWHQLMLGEILRQLIRGDGSVFCPRAHATVPGVTTMNLAFEGDCQRHLRLGCGTFRPGQAAMITPKCLFEDALRVCALQR
jgi:hypothetical protein